MDRLQIPNSLISPGLTTPTQRRSPRDLLSPTGAMAAAEEQLDNNKRRMKFPWQRLFLASVVFLGLVAWTNKHLVWKRHDQPEMQDEDGAAIEYDEQFVAAEMAAIQAGQARKRHDQPEMQDEDGVATEVDQQFVEAALAAMQAGQPIKRQSEEHLNERRYIDGVPADMYRQTNPHPSSRQAQQAQQVSDAQINKRDQIPLQRPPKVLDDFVDAHLWVPDESKLSVAEKEQIRVAAQQAANTRRDALQAAAGGFTAADVDELEHDAKAWWAQTHLSPEAVQRDLNANAEPGVAWQAAEPALPAEQGDRVEQLDQVEKRTDEKDTAYIASRVKAFGLQLQQGVAWEKQITQDGPSAAADAGGAAPIARWTCISSPADNNSRIKVGYVGTSNNLQCQGPNNAGCYWYPATDVACVNAPWGSTAPISLVVETGFKCTQYATGWCSTARQALPGQNQLPATPNWKCVLSVADGNSYVQIGYVIVNGAYTSDYQLQCQGPSGTQCSWFWDAGCAQPKSPGPVAGQGVRCLYYGGGWCQAGRAVLPANPAPPAPAPPVNTRPRRNGADWTCIQNGNLAEWMFVSYVSYDFNRIQCRGAKYDMCTRFTDSKCTQKYPDSWDIDWYWEAGIFCDTKGTAGPGWCQNARRQLPAPYYYPTGAVQGAIGPGVVGYFPNWNAWAMATYDFTSIGYVCYAFVQAAPSGDLVPGETIADGGMMYQLNVQAKAKYPGLKTFASFGGGGQSGWFPALSASEAARKNFAAKVAAFLIANRFDGVDLDWEYPNPDSEEPRNLLLLLQDVRAAIGRSVLLTMAVTPMPNLYRNYAYEYSQYVNWVNVMTYDITGSWGQVTGFPSAMYPDFATPHGTDAVSTAAWRWFYAGMPRHKISVGAAFYGYGWQVAPNSPNGGLFQKNLGVATNVPYADGSGAFVWRWLRSPEGVLQAAPNVTSAGWVRQWRAPAQMATLYNAAQGSVLIVDDVQSLREKARWTRTYGFGGVSVWDLSMDWRRELVTSLAGTWWSTTPGI